MRLTAHSLGAQLQGTMASSVTAHTLLPSPRSETKDSVFLGMSSAPSHHQTLLTTSSASQSLPSWRKFSQTHLT